MSLPVEDAEDDVPEAGDRDAAAQGLGPLAAAEVYEVEPRAAAQEDVGGVGGLPVAHRVLVHVQREDEVGVATLNSFGGLVEIFLKFYEIFFNYMRTPAAAAPPNTPASPRICC